MTLANTTAALWLVFFLVLWALVCLALVWVVQRWGKVQQELDEALLHPHARQPLPAPRKLPTVAAGALSTPLRTSSGGERVRTHCEQLGLCQFQVNGKTRCTLCTHQAQRANPAPQTRP
jgi:hypothetical protein